METPAPQALLDAWRNKYSPRPLIFCGAFFKVIQQRGNAISHLIGNA
jgi:hypothetical protein